MIEWFAIDDRGGGKGVGASFLGGSGGRGSRWDMFVGLGGGLGLGSGYFIGFRHEQRHPCMAQGHGDLMKPLAIQSRFEWIEKPG